MTWQGAAILFYMAAVGYLIWRGSGSLLKAVFGGFALPIIMWTMLGLVLGIDAAREIGMDALFIASIFVFAFLIWQRVKSE